MSARSGNRVPPVPSPGFSDDEIQRALSEDRPVEPSLGFQARVMRRLRSDAELPPLALPWKRFVAALVAAFGALAMAATVDPDLLQATARPGLLFPTVVLLVLAARCTIRSRLASEMAASRGQDSTAG
ncbi:MAG: hypothetical protein R3325_01025 [Thermoanaerobaculia bacterium]|nr:hypothetical protein [Thermoanaerobaculia bacterium]